MCAIALNAAHVLLIIDLIIDLIIERLDPLLLRSIHAARDSVRLAQDLHASPEALERTHYVQGRSLA